MTTSIASLKAQLGLEIPKTYSKTDPPEIIRLLEGFTGINKRYADHNPQQIRASEPIRNDASELFERLGPTLWPDLEKEAGLPSWLSCPPSDSKEQCQGRRYYSNSTDYEFLADRFYDLVCLKLRQHYRNSQRAKANPDPHINRERLFDVGETRGFGYHDESALQDVTDYEYNNVTWHSTPEIRAQREDSVPLSINSESAQLDTAPPAPRMNAQSAMGDTQSKLAESKRKFRHAGLDRHVEQREKANGASSRQPRSDSAGVEIMPSPTRASRRRPSTQEMPQSLPGFVRQNEKSLPHTTQTGKRPIFDDTPGRKTKRSKKHSASDVQAAKPTLVVVLKLTRGKVNPNRPTTTPPRQPCTLIPSIETDEITVRPLSTFASRYDTAVSGPEAGDERASIQPVVPDHEPLNSISEAAVDAERDVSDITSDCDMNGSMIRVEDTIEPLDAMQRQPHVSQQHRDSKVMARFLELWSGEAYGLVNEILTASLKQHTPEEVLDDHLLPRLRKIRDQLPSTEAQRDQFSTANLEQAAAQGLDLRQQEHTTLQQSTEPFDLASQTQPTEGTSLLNDGDGSSAKSSEPASEDCNIPAQPTDGHRDSVVTTASLNGTREAAKADVHSEQQLHETHSALTSHQTLPNVIPASQVARDADQNHPFDCNRLVQNIEVTIYIDRDDGLELRAIGTTGIENMLDGNDFFKAVQAHYGIQGWGVLESDEELFAARITEADRVAERGLKTDLLLRNNSRRDRSWQRWLSQLRECYERERVDIRMDLVAQVLVAKKNDAKY